MTLKTKREHVLQLYMQAVTFTLNQRRLYTSTQQMIQHNRGPQWTHKSSEHIQSV